MAPLSSIYTERLEQFEQELNITRRNITIIAWLRLIAFIASAFFAYKLIKAIDPLYIVVAVIFFIAFIVFIKITFRLGDKRDLLTKLVYVNKNEIAIINGEESKFSNGIQFSTPEGFTGDLDIFGKGSMFHLLNRSTTVHGNEKLAVLLASPILNRSLIMEQQQAIQVLGEQLKHRQLLTAHGLLHEEKEGNLSNISSWLEEPVRFLKQRFVLIFRWLLPLYNLGALYYALDTENTLPLVTGVLLSWLIIGLNFEYITKQHTLLSKKQAILDQYAGVLKIFSTVSPGNSVFLKKVQKDIDKAHHSISALARLSAIFDQRLNLLVNSFLNSLFVYDIHCLVALEKWKEKNKTNFNEWIESVGSIESLNSLATFAFNNPSYQYATITDGNLSVETVGIAHPLIDAKKRIPNDFTIGKTNKLILVTGSNMSGKTTFLRTLGVNLVLAQCGAPVCANSFSFTPMHIQSSIRVSDSLQESTSYFMAELKRLHDIVIKLESGEPSLVLIDEILRGTNSDDKTHGSEQFIKKLIAYNCLTMFATHDLSLSVLENESPEKIDNYCFESVIENGELIFDYKLRKGVARNKNASFLMQKMGIIDRPL